VELDLVQATDVLRRTPAVLDGLLRGLPDRWARATEGGESWSTADVVGHLLHMEAVNWIPRCRFLLEHGAAAAFPPLDRFAFVEESAGRGLDALLPAFAEARARSLRELAALGLTPADLARPGRHPDLGPVTLGHLLATWMVHDLNHVEQIVHTLAKQHDAAVGPWRAYLGILTRPSEAAG
jgi:uncharacterized damage-inducible protein DinB